MPVAARRHPHRFLCEDEDEDEDEVKRGLSAARQSR